MVTWTELFGIVQAVANEKGATQSDHRSVARSLGDWWSDGGKETAKDWSRSEAREWAERNVRI